MSTLRTVLVVIAVTLAACPPPQPPPDGDATADVGEPDVPEPLGFGACETALDCATYPNSASLCDHEECLLQCIPGFANCDRELPNGCEQSLSTASHCGGCDAPCAPYKAFGTCSGGECVIAACNLGFGDCDGQRDNGCETLLVTPTDCVACGVPCTVPNAEPTCDAGQCGVASCLAGFGDCDDQPETGCEVSVDTRSRCGDCDTSCDSGHGCATDHCVPVWGPVTPLPLPATAVAVAVDGTVYTAATPTEDVPWGEDVLAVTGSSDALLMRHGSDGQPGWAVVIGGPNTASAHALTVAPDGAVTVAGAFQSGTKLDGGLLTHTGGTDVFLASFEANGDVRWGVGVGGLGHDTPTALDSGPAGEVVLVGGAMPPASFGGDILTGHADISLGFVARYASTGTPSWSVAVSGAEPVLVLDVVVTSDGAIHALVDAASPIDVANAEVAPAGVTVVTWLADGTFVQAHPCPVDSALALAVTPDGTAYVAGTTADLDGAIVRLGEQVQAPIAFSGISDLAAGPAGRLYAVGHTSGAFDVGLGPVIVDGVYAARYDDAQPSPTWFVGLDDAGSPASIATSPQGVLVAAESISTLDE